MPMSAYTVRATGGHCLCGLSKPVGGDEAFCGASAPVRGGVWELRAEPAAGLKEGAPDELDAERDQQERACTLRRLAVHC